MYKKKLQLTQLKQSYNLIKKKVRNKDETYRARIEQNDIITN